MLLMTETNTNSPPKRPTAAELEKAEYLALEGYPISEEAKTLVADMSAEYLDTTSRRPTPAQRNALAAFLCDLLQNAKPDRLGWSYRAYSTASFSKERVGYKGFHKVERALTMAGLIDFERGHQQWLTCDFGPSDAPRTVDWARASRFRARPSLFEVIAGYGINPDNWEDHFGLIKPEGGAIKDPLRCRKASIRFMGEKYRGHMVAVDLK